jgi:hypothetical protein
MKEKIRARGCVTVRVLDRMGNIKRCKPSFFRRLLHIQGRQMESRHHNIVTREGDALIADALIPSPQKTKVGASGYIQVGTGYTGNSVKTTYRCNTPSGSFEIMDSGYPQLKAAFGATGDTTIISRATFEAGDLNASGINEAALCNGSSSTASCLAYAQLTPVVNITTADTLQVQWEITILGQ